jgi:hypothetical protein
VIVLRYMDVAYGGVVRPVNVPNITGISNIHVGQSIYLSLFTSFMAVSLL